MQNFLSLWLNAGAQITHGGQVQRPRQKRLHDFIAKVLLIYLTFDLFKEMRLKQMLFS